MSGKPQGVISTSLSFREGLGELEMASDLDLLVVALGCPASYVSTPEQSHRQGTHSL